jgi:Domain of unknown function (DUF4485)
MANDLTPEQNFMNRLDDHFIFLLQFANDPISKLPSEKQALAKEWILKLSSMVEDQYQNITMKQRRNEYLTKVLSCIQNGILCDPFNQPPLKNSQLPDIDFGFALITQDIPKWVNELKEREENQVKIGGKSFETYLSSKLLENGACAYLAVSAQNEGNRSAWMKIQPNKIISEEIDKIFEKEFRGKLRYSKEN